MEPISTTQEQRCPRCKEDLTSYLREKSDLEFCLFCRFPLGPVAGKYKLFEPLGEGGFGTVYRARHLTMERDAERVIKVIKPEILNKPGIKERFLREVQMTSALSQHNPHIVRVFDDFGEIPHFGYFYVMEHLNGKPLTDYLNDPAQLPTIAWCLDVFAQLCDAMQAAHEEQIVHRDLKPDNIFLIHHRRRDNFVKVLDFGIAKPLNTDPNAGKLTQGIVGTPYYIAPEQANNGPIDARTDIYAMGVILHEMLTGEIPLIPPSRMESLNLIELLTIRIMAKEIPSLRKIRPDRDIPEGVDLAVLKALSDKPDDRFPSAEAFWQALQPYARESTGYGLAHSGDAHPNPPSDPAYVLRGSSSPAHPLPTGTPSASEHRLHPHPSLDATDDMLPSGLPTPDRSSPNATPRPPALSTIDLAPIGKASSQRPTLIATVVGLCLIGALGTLLLVSSFRTPSSHHPIEPLARLGSQTKSPRHATHANLGASAQHTTPPSITPDASTSTTTPDTSTTTPELPASTDVPNDLPLTDASPSVEPPIYRTPTKRRTKRRPLRRRPPTPEPQKTQIPIPPTPSPPPTVKKNTPCKDNEVYLVTSPRLSLKKKEITCSPSTACRLVGEGYCIRANAKQIGLDREGYTTCIFSLPKRRKRLRAVLKEDDNSFRTQDYCLQKKR